MRKCGGGEGRSGGREREGTGNTSLNNLPGRLSSQSLSNIKEKNKCEGRQRGNDMRSNLQNKPDDGQTRWIFKGNERGEEEENKKRRRGERGRYRYTQKK